LHAPCHGDFFALISALPLEIKALAKAPKKRAGIKVHFGGIFLH
jgi:hypothetical protein